MVVRVDRHIDIPLISLEEVEIEPGSESRDAHVEFRIGQTVDGEGGRGC